MTLILKQTNDPVSSALATQGSEVELPVSIDASPDTSGQPLCIRCGAHLSGRSQSIIRTRCCAKCSWAELQGYDVHDIVDENGLTVIPSNGSLKVSENRGLVVCPPLPMPCSFCQTERAMLPLVVQQRRQTVKAMPLPLCFLCLA